MWDEEINKKIKDAADHYHPAYDDDAWNKMEQMLDEHLPLKKDRRRVIYFLTLILLLSGIIFFVISRNESTPSSKISAKTVLKNKPGSQQELQNVSPEVAANSNPVTSGANLTAGAKEHQVIKEPPVNVVHQESKRINPSAHVNMGMANRNTQLTSNITAGNQEKQTESSSLPGKVNPKGKPTENIGSNEPIDQTVNQSDEKVASPPVANNNDPLKTNTTVTEDNNATVKSKDVAKAENPKVAGSRQNKLKKNFMRNFGIGLSAGPDVSAVKLKNAGKMTFTYGAQLSYSFTDKFTLRTGFYVAKKVYSVDDNEYHVAPGSTWNQYLQSVDADCKVYEIPLTLSYSFGKTKNHSWYASAGLSSYFMKRESYMYYYKPPMGASYSKPWTVTNQNKHYFSVLDISAGYGYSVNKRFSIIAEPYVKLPLSGIGLGKIKLNSAGILFTAAIKPFLKK